MAEQPFIEAHVAVSAGNVVVLEEDCQLITEIPIDFILLPVFKQDPASFHFSFFPDPFIFVGFARFLTC